jgi:hypothetical protein
MNDPGAPAPPPYAAAAPAAPAVDIGPWVTEGWKMFAGHWGTWSKMSVLVALPILFPMIGYFIGYFGFIFSILPRPGEMGPYGGGPPQIPVWALTVWGVSAFLAILGSFVSAYFQIGMWKSALKQARGGTPDTGDLKGNGHLFGRVILASIVLGLLQLVGVFFCFVGQFVVLGWYFYTIPLIIDKDLPIGEAMRQSKAATSPQLLMYILFAYVTQVLAGLGAMLCLVGLVFSFPLKFTIEAVSYRQTFGGSPPGPPAFPAPSGPGPITY